jgi:hypothetical protein
MLIVFARSTLGFKFLRPSEKSFHFILPMIPASHSVLPAIPIPPHPGRDDPKTFVLADLGSTLEKNGRDSFRVMKKVDRV